MHGNDDANFNVWLCVVDDGGYTNVKPGLVASNQCAIAKNGHVMCGLCRLVQGKQYT